MIAKCLTVNLGDDAHVIDARLSHQHGPTVGSRIATRDRISRGSARGLAANRGLLRVAHGQQSTILSGYHCPFDEDRTVRT